MEDIINGLKFLHTQKIFHKDLTSENILVGDHNELVINYLCDKTLTETPPPNCELNDVYHLGLILYEIYTLSELKESEDIIQFSRLEGERILEIEELILRMLEKDVRKRITLDEIEEEIKELPINDYSSLPPSSYSTVSDSISECSELPSYHYSLILLVYLKNGAVNGKTLKEISEMNSSEFKSYWNDGLMIVFIYIVYPNVYSFFSLH